MNRIYEENILNYYFEYSEPLDNPFDQSLVDFLNVGISESTVTVTILKEKYGEDRRLFSPLIGLEKILSSASI